MGMPFSTYQNSESVMAAFNNVQVNNDDKET